MVYSASNQYSGQFHTRKMAFDDEETLAELLQEILSCISDAIINKNDIQIESSHESDKSEGETAHFYSNDPEPMEAHETKQTAQADYEEVIDLIIIVVYFS